MGKNHHALFKLYNHLRTQNELEEIRPVAIVSIILTLIPLLFFIIKFYLYKLSSDSEDWNCLGVYLDGTIGSIIAFLILLTTTYITLALKEYEDSRDKKNQEY